MNFMKTLAFGLLRIAAVLFVAAWSCLAIITIFTFFDSSSSITRPWGWVFYPATILWGLAISWAAGQAGSTTHST